MRYLSTASSVSRQSHNKCSKCCLSARIHRIHAVSRFRPNDDKFAFYSDDRLSDGSRREDAASSPGSKLLDHVRSDNNKERKQLAQCWFPGLAVSNAKI